MKIRENFEREIENTLDDMKDICFNSYIFNQDVNIEVLNDPDNYYISDKEFSINKKVIVKAKNGNIIMIMPYRNVYSDSSNGGVFELYTLYNFAPNEDYPNGYKLMFHNKLGDRITYTVEEKKYSVINHLALHVSDANGNKTYYDKSNAETIIEKDSKVIDSFPNEKHMLQLLQILKDKNKELNPQRLK